MKNQVNFFYTTILKVKRYLGHQDSRVWKAVWRLEKFKLVSNGTITNKIPFGLYRRFDHVTTRFISPYTSKNGILFVKYIYWVYILPAGILINHMHCFASVTWHVGVAGTNKLYPFGWTHIKLWWWCLCKNSEKMIGSFINSHPACGWQMLNILRLFYLIVLKIGIMCA